MFLARQLNSDTGIVPLTTLLYDIITTQVVVLGPEIRRAPGRSCPADLERQHTSRCYFVWKGGTARITNFSLVGANNLSSLNFALTLRLLLPPTTPPDLQRLLYTTIPRSRTPQNPYYHGCLPRRTPASLRKHIYFDTINCTYLNSTTTTISLIA